MSCCWMRSGVPAPRWPLPLRKVGLTPGMPGVRRSHAGLQNFHAAVSHSESASSTPWRSNRSYSKRTLKRSPILAPIPAPYTGPRTLRRTPRGCRARLPHRHWRRRRNSRAGHRPRTSSPAESCRRRGAKPSIEASTLRPAPHGARPAQVDVVEFEREEVVQPVTAEKLVRGIVLVPVVDGVVDLVHVTRRCMCLTSRRRARCSR